MEDVISNTEVEADTQLEKRVDPDNVLVEEDTDAPDVTFQQLVS